SVLAEISSELGVGDLLRLGDGELKTGGASRPSILGDALEAILGAAFLDANFAVASELVRRLFATRVETMQDERPAKDAKTGLQEWLQSQRLPLPAYAVKRIEGVSHRQTFHVECEVAAFGVKTAGTGATRRLAEQDAAARALVQLTAESVAQRVAHGPNHGR
ncbi:MAG: putative dsRNA-binding protein, partial [Usitatibacteraceae bacterium]